MYISRAVNYTSSITSSITLASSIPSNLLGSVAYATIPVPSTFTTLSSLLQKHPENTWDTPTIYGLVFGICSILIGIPGCIFAIRTRHQASVVSPSAHEYVT